MATALNSLTQMSKIPGVSQALQQAPGASFDPRIEEVTKEAEPIKQKIALGEKQELEERQRTAEQEAGIKARQTRGIADIEAEKARKISEAPGRKDVEELGKQEKDFLFQPGERDGLALATTASLMMVIGTALGKGGKFTAMNALSGMNGMMEGYRKRSDDLYKQEKQQFETNSKALRDKLNFAIQALERYEKDVVRDAEVAKMNLNADLSKEGLDFVKARGERAPIAKQLPELRKMAAALDKQLADLKAKQATAQERAAEDVRLKTMAAALQQPKESPEQKAISKMGTAGAQASIYQKTGKVVTDRRDAEAILNTVSALDEIKRLKERLQDPEIVTGLQAMPQPFFQKLRSLVGQNVNENEVRNFVDSELTGNDKTTLFIKDAILAGFKIEQGLTGNRVPVFTQKTVGPILDPRNYRPETYNSLLSSRQEELLDRAYDRGIEEEDIAKLKRPRKEQSAATTAPAAPKYQLNQIIERGGKKYRVTSVANPNDPDVEEVK